VTSYQSTVLKASEEVEDGLVTFLRAHNRAADLREAVKAEQAAFNEAFAQYKGGLVDFNRVVVIQERLVTRQQTLAESQGQVATGLIQVYRALGGGWQIRNGANAAGPLTAANAVPAEGMIKDKAEPVQPAPKIEALPVPPKARNGEPGMFEAEVIWESSKRQAGK
jgi:hypothetical protein